MGSSLIILVKSWSNSHSNYLSQECDSKILNLNNQESFYSYEYMSGFQNFKRELPAKKIYRSLAGINTIHMSFNISLMFRINLKMKKMRDYHNLADVF